MASAGGLQSDAEGGRRGSEKTFVFRALAAPVIPLVAALVKLDVQDAEKLPRAGAFVLASNHYSDFDPIVIGWSVWKRGRAPRFLAKASLFAVPVLGSALRAIKQVPVERSGRTRGNNPLSAAHDLAVSGEGIIVYPEGTLTRDPGLWPMRGKTGAVRIALENGLPVIPVAHWGTQAVLPRWSKKLSLFPRKTVQVKYGGEVDLSHFRDRPLTQTALTEATSLVMDAITGLLEDLRGEKAPAERWNPQDHSQSEYGRP